MSLLILCFLSLLSFSSLFFLPVCVPFLSPVFLFCFVVFFFLSFRLSTSFSLVLLSCLHISLSVFAFFLTFALFVCLCLLLSVPYLKGPVLDTPCPSDDDDDVPMAMENGFKVRGERERAPGAVSLQQVCSRCSKLHDDLQRRSWWWAVCCVVFASE